MLLNVSASAIPQTRTPLRRPFNCPCVYVGRATIDRSMHYRSVFSRSVSCETLRSGSEAYTFVRSLFFDESSARRFGVFSSVCRLFVRFSSSSSSSRECWHTFVTWLWGKQQPRHCRYDVAVAVAIRLIAAIL